MTSNSNRCASFDDSARRVLAWLRARLDFDAWIVTRIRGEDWIVMEADDRSYGLTAGDILPWNDSICARMVRGQGPNVAPRCNEEPAYADAPIRRDRSIEAYVGYPLRSREGRLLGTLCGLATTPRRELDDSERETLELMCGLLGQLLEQELERTELARRNERFRFEAMTDSLTHLPNRRAWEEKLASEQRRSSRLGESTFVSVIDLDGFKAVNDRDGHPEGDRLLRNAALALRYAVRNSDFVARVGGDEFTVLGIQCGSVDADDISERLQRSLAQSGIRASVGTALAGPMGDHAEVWAKADRAMYDNKRAGTRVPLPGRG